MAKSAYAAEVTARVVQAAGVPEAKAQGCYRYLNSSNIDKEEVTREFAAKQRPGKTGRVCVLQCIEPCWTFDWSTTNGISTIHGEPGKCSHLYHYYQHPTFGWLYVRLQTWFPFEIQVGLNGREWLARQMSQQKLDYHRHDNKFLWVRDWQRAQQLLDEQLQTAPFQSVSSGPRRTIPRGKSRGAPCGEAWRTWLNGWEWVLRAVPATVPDPCLPPGPLPSIPSVKICRVCRLCGAGAAMFLQSIYFHIKIH